jgi:phage shock protein A
VYKRQLQGYVAALLAKRREMEAALADFRKSRAAAAASTGPAAGSAAPEQRLDKITSAFDRIYERQTGLSPTGRSGSLQQAAQLKELDDLVRDNKIAERLALLKQAKAAKP